MSVSVNKVRIKCGMIPSCCPYLAPWFYCCPCTGTNCIQCGTWKRAAKGQWISCPLPLHGLGDQHSSVQLWWCCHTQLWCCRAIGYRARDDVMTGEFTLAYFEKFVNMIPNECSTLIGLSFLHRCCKLFSNVEKKEPSPGSNFFLISVSNFDNSLDCEHKKR